MSGLVAAMAGTSVDGLARGIWPRGVVAAEHLSTLREVYHGHDTASLVVWVVWVVWGTASATGRALVWLVHVFFSGSCIRSSLTLTY